MGEAARVTGERHRLPPNIPRRLLNEEQAAEYCGVSLNTFRAQSGDGKPFPPSITLGKRKLYDRMALDRAIDALSGLDKPVSGEGWGSM